MRACVGICLHIGWCPDSSKPHTSVSKKLGKCTAGPSVRQCPIANSFKENIVVAFDGAWSTRGGSSSRQQVRPGGQPTGPLQHETRITAFAAGRGDPVRPQVALTRMPFLSYDNHWKKYQRLAFTFLPHPLPVTFGRFGSKNILDLAVAAVMWWSFGWGIAYGGGDGGYAVNPFAGHESFFSRGEEFQDVQGGYGTAEGYNWAFFLFQVGCITLRQMRLKPNLPPGILLSPERRMIENVRREGVWPQCSSAAVKT